MIDPCNQNCKCAHLLKKIIQSEKSHVSQRQKFSEAKWKLTTVPKPREMKSAHDTSVWISIYVPKSKEIKSRPCENSLADFGTSALLKAWPSPFLG